jgi:hypothetical protein
MPDAPFENTLAIARSHLGESWAAQNWAGAGDKQWCSAFAAQVFKESGYGAILEGCENIYWVPTLFDHGRNQGLNANTQDGVPPVGSLVSIGDQGHVMIVSEVLDGGQVKVIHGNYSGRVQETIFSVSELDPEYVSGTKIVAKVTPHAAVVSDKSEIQTKGMPALQPLSPPKEYTGMAGLLKEIEALREKHRSKIHLTDSDLAPKPPAPHVIHMSSVPSGASIGG